MMNENFERNDVPGWGVSSWIGDPGKVLVIKEVIWLKKHLGILIW